MKTVNFTASENLLKDVITRQAGSPLKGIIELIQNSIDAITVQRRSKPRFKGKIEIEVNESGNQSILTFSDNGVGLGKTQKEVERNFSVFGLGNKREDTELLGEFGMGRGQTISMIYNPEKDKLDGSIEVRSNGHALKNFRVDNELSFDIEKSTPKTTGTQWHIKSNKPRFFTRLGISKYISDNVRTDISICYNNDQIKITQPRGKKVLDDEDVSVWVEKNTSDFRLFDRAFYVCRLDVVKGWGGTIVSRVPLKQNFARNDVIDGDATVTKAHKWILSNVISEIGNFTTTTRLNDDKRKGILTLLENTPRWLDKWRNLKVFTLTNGKKVSYDGLSGSEIYSGNKGDIVCDKLNQKLGIAVLDGTTWSQLNVLGNERRIRDFKSAPKGSKAYQILTGISGEKHQTVVLTPEKAKLLSVFQEVFDTKSRELRFGESKVSQGWTNGRTYVFLDIGYIDEQLERYQPLGLLRVLVAMHGLVAHEMAHNNDDTITMQHGYDFEKHEIQWREEELFQVLRISQSKLVKYEKALGWNGKLPMAAKTKPTTEGHGYFEELTQEAGASLVRKKDRIAAKFKGRNLATLLRRGGGWTLVLNGITADEVPGSKPVKSWQNYASVDASNPDAKKLLLDHISWFTGFNGPTSQGDK